MTRLGNEAFSLGQSQLTNCCSSIGLAISRLLQDSNCHKVEGRGRGHANHPQGYDNHACLESVEHGDLPATTPNRIDTPDDHMASKDGKSSRSNVNGTARQSIQISVAHRMYSANSVSLSMK